MLCTDLALMGTSTTKLHCRPLKCKRWTCEDCGSINRRRLIGIAIDGEPTTLLTLTTNPNHEADPERAADKLMNAWQRLARQLRREYGKRSFSYLAIWERTQRGMPHLHILLRAPYIPQRRISAHMAQAIAAPIVDIRKVKSARMVANYVAKYVSKEAAKFDGHNRFSRSRNWQDTATAERNKWTPPEDILWEVVHLTPVQAAQYLTRAGLTPKWDGDGWTLPRPITRERGSP